MLACISTMSRKHFKDPFLVVVLFAKQQVSALVQWLEYQTLVREGPGSKPARVKNYYPYIQWMQ